MNPWVRLLRPGNGAISFVGTVVGGLSATGLLEGRLGTEIGPLLLAGLTTFLVASGGNVLNDYLDREGDRKNHPDRPLPRGEVAAESVRAFAAGLFLLSGVPLLGVFLWGKAPTGLAGEAMPVGVWLAAVLLLLAYELRWKPRGLLGNATVAALTGAVFLFGATIVGAPLLAVSLAAMASLATLSREIIKDMEDAEGDVDRHTLPRDRGMAVASLAARGAVVAAIALSPIPLVLWRPPLPVPAAIIYLTFVAAADLVFVLSVRTLPKELHREQSLSKLAMVLALVGFLGAALR
ncbi:MAG: geranylgeranylglycerol-phosphate geranylgeranyltransferase [Euryarchaeota archaeon]|nr:geranylgeranylglycerol-phosphate geranylgeranyltransferase [Euryarchaeota archaeon]MDE1835908.1 geranylgeranylglycerol-phosphate geranylgeranyltransferase [Euryarchaeota archaeon]MDE2044414.1 geranylgeranylglycerol-phosphate geranylgeranyltransferase [Thermoplasmata archaeon]